MRMTSLLTTGAVLAALGCSSEKVIPPANLSGTWDFSYVTRSAAGATCRGTMTFTISQTDQTFVGFQNNPGQLFCEGVATRLVASSVSDPNEFDGERITAGVASESEVAFALNTLKSSDAGMLVQAGVLSGTTTWTVPVQPRGNVTFTGTWTAFKRSQ